MKTVLIDYGSGNIKSIQFALARIGCHAVLSNNPEMIKNADRVIFPGVGEASNAMLKLKKSKLDILIPDLKQPVLGICLGMQLMCEHTAEGDTDGLGIFQTNVLKFSNNIKVPEVGWNNITKLSSQLFDNVEESVYMYFVHSFYATICQDTVALIDGTIPYSAALKNNNFYGVQFHPEKSGKLGEQILKNFLIN